MGTSDNNTTKSNDKNDSSDCNESKSNRSFDEANDNASSKSNTSSSSRQAVAIEALAGLADRGGPPPQHNHLQQQLKQQHDNNDSSSFQRDEHKMMNNNKRNANSSMNNNNNNNNNNGKASQNLSGPLPTMPPQQQRLHKRCTSEEFGLQSDDNAANIDLSMLKQQHQQQPMHPRDMMRMMQENNDGMMSNMNGSMMMGNNSGSMKGFKPSAFSFPKNGKADMLSNMNDNNGLNEMMDFPSKFKMQQHPLQSSRMRSLGGGGDVTGRGKMRMNANMMRNNGVDDSTMMMMMGNNNNPVGGPGMMRNGAGRFGKGFGNMNSLGMDSGDEDDDLGPGMNDTNNNMMMKYMMNCRRGSDPMAGMGDLDANGDMMMGMGMMDDNFSSPSMATALGRNPGQRRMTRQGPLGDIGGMSAMSSSGADGNMMLGAPYGNGNSMGDLGRMKNNSSMLMMGDGNDIGKMMSKRNAAMMRNRGMMNMNNNMNHLDFDNSIMMGNSSGSNNRMMNQMMMMQDEDAMMNPMHNSSRKQFKSGRYGVGPNNDMGFNGMQGMGMMGRSNMKNNAIMQQMMMKNGNGNNNVMEGLDDGDDDDQGPPKQNNKMSNSTGKQKKQRKPRAPSGTSFPTKLHSILSNPEYQDMISWLPHGRAFRILKPKAFSEQVIPKYFRSDRYASFMRQVNGWGFTRISEGRDLNAYYHERFLRGLPDLCYDMRRPAKARSAAERNTIGGQSPDFYKISKFAPLPETNTSSKNNSDVEPEQSDDHPDGEMSGKENMDSMDAREITNSDGEEDGDEQGIVRESYSKKNDNNGTIASMDSDEVKSSRIVSSSSSKTNNDSKDNSSGRSSPKIDTNAIMKQSRNAPQSPPPSQQQKRGSLLLGVNTPSPLGSTGPEDFSFSNRLQGSTNFVGANMIIPPSATKSNGSHQFGLDAGSINSWGDGLDHDNMMWSGNQNGMMKTSQMLVDGMSKNMSANRRGVGQVTPPAHPMGGNLRRPSAGPYSNGMGMSSPNRRGSEETGNSLTLADLSYLTKQNNLLHRQARDGNAGRDVSTNEDEENSILQSVQQRHSL